MRLPCQTTKSFVRMQIASKWYRHLKTQKRFSAGSVIVRCALIVQLSGTKVSHANKLKRKIMRDGHM